jgi:hypothetical protein
MASLEYNPQQIENLSPAGNKKKEADVVIKQTFEGEFSCS